MSSLGVHETNKSNFYAETFHQVTVIQDDSAVIPTQLHKFQFDCSSSKMQSVAPPSYKSINLS